MVRDGGECVYMLVHECICASAFVYIYLSACLFVECPCMYVCLCMSSNEQIATAIISGHCSGCLFKYSWQPPRPT